jgi:predicted transcriptional regulator
MKPIAAAAITPVEIEKARALLKWSRDRLAAMSGIPVGVIARLERERAMPKPDQLSAIIAALEEADVVFIVGKKGRIDVKLQDTWFG